MFVSKDYEASAFPTTERRAAFAGAMHGSATVLPVRFDETRVPGLNVNVGFLDAREHTPAQLAEKIARKLEAAGVPLRMPTVSSFASVPRDASTTPFSVTIADPDGNPVDDAVVAAVISNGNVIQVGALGAGRYACLAPARRRLRLWIGHPAHIAAKIDDVDASSDLVVALGLAAGTGSTIFFGASGHLPTVRGRFNVHLDAYGRSYVHIDNAAANGKPARPFHFDFGTPFDVEDTDASVTVVTFVDATGNGSLVEYVTPARR
jgi:hypothetical protein